MKKGFTLIEFIISLVIIVFVASISLASFKLIKNQKSIKTLNNMSEEILTAATLYVETNTEIKTNLYNKKESVIIPLLTLENEGLIDFNGINIKDEYVVTMLGSEEVGEECISTYTLKSWEFPNDKVIYICTNEKTNESNNYNDRVYRGYNPNNYVKIKYSTYETSWRIVEIVNQDIKLIASNSNYLIKKSSGFPTSLSYLPNKILKQSYYVSQESNRGEEDNLDISDFIRTEKKYVGLIDYLSIINANATDGNWLYEMLSNFALEKSSDINIGYNGCIDYKYNSSSNTKYVNFSNGYLNDECDSGYYAPLITLNNCVELQIDTTCSTNYEIGSQDCPYLVNSTKC